MAAFRDDDTAVPDELTCGDQIFDLAFHPRYDALAVGLIDGSVEVYKYEAGNSGAESKRMIKHTEHEGSCRGTLFTDDGERLYTISSDCSIFALDGGGRTVMKIPDAHDDALNRIASVSEGGFLLATGDDAGCVKLWDMRISPTASASCEVMSWTLHEDFVSGFTVRADNQTLISVGGDARLCTYDLRKPSNTFKSDDQEAELQCVQVMKNGRKVVCGTQEGVLLFFSWDKWGDCSDRFPGHPETVDCMMKIDESTVLTGSSDGLIRVVALQPNKVLGVVGDHDEFPVEGMRPSRDGRVLGSFAHDNTVRFWDISMFADDEDDDGEGDMEDEDEDGAPRPRKKVVEGEDEEEAAAAEGMELDAEDAGDEEEMDEDDEDDEDDDDSDMDDDDDSDDDDSDDDDSKPAPGAAAGRKKLPTATEKFYADL